MGELAEEVMVKGYGSDQSLLNAPTFRVYCPSGTLVGIVNEMEVPSLGMPRISNIAPVVVLINCTALSISVNPDPVMVTVDPDTPFWGTPLSLDET